MNKKRRSLAPWLGGALITLCVLIALWLPRSGNDGTGPLVPPLGIEKASAQCVDLGPQPGTYQEANITAPGVYCLTTDLRQRRLHGAGHSFPPPHHALIDIAGGNVTLDLMGHTLHSDGHSSGLTAFTPQNAGAAEREKRSFGQTTRNIIIKNGVIDLRGLGQGVKLIDRWWLRSIDQQTPKDLQGYEKKNFVLENLLIRTDNVGVMLEGDGNILRNCIIESNGVAAIVFAGPNSRITNNKVILTDRFMPGLLPFTWAKMLDGVYDPQHFYREFKARNTLKAAIVIHQGTGSVISGNWVEVEGKSPTRHNIYITDSSKDVRVVGNTIVRGREAATIANDSNAIVKDNVFAER